MFIKQDYSQLLQTFNIRLYVTEILCIKCDFKTKYEPRSQSSEVIPRALSVFADQIRFSRLRRNCSMMSGIMEVGNAL